MRGVRRTLEEFAVARENVGRAERSQRRDVIGLPKSGERFAERSGTKVSADRELAAHDFQNSLLVAAGAESGSRVSIAR